MASVSLRLRLVALLAVLATLLVVVWAQLESAIDRVEQNRTLVTDVLMPASVDSRALLIAVVDQETGQRGYVLTGDAVFLEPYRQGTRDFVSRVADLREEFAADEMMLQAIDRVEDAATN